MGPIRLLDEVGLDVAAHVSEIMVAGYGERMKAPTYAKTLASHSKLGRKSGSGFYDFSHEKISPSPVARELLKLPKATKEVTNINPLQERLIMSLLNEAVKCLDEGVAGQPGKDSASQINLGTVMGMGFPPFRGGLLYFADSLGAKNILEGLQKMEREHGARFAPAQGIIERAGNNQSFCG
jgi:3-hydroxyacyl-CoA dehydrogenase/enoyl-CoA hydratase/3-hydroxybutyryl-CoA epimerase